VLATTGHAPLAAALVAREHLAEQQSYVSTRAAHPASSPVTASHPRPSPSCFPLPSLVAAVPIVRPATVIRWHRSLWETTLAATISPTSRATAHRCGHPSPHPPHGTENPTWGEDQIAGPAGQTRSLRVSENRLQVQGQRGCLAGRGQKWSTFVPTTSARPGPLTGSPSSPCASRSYTPSSSSTWDGVKSCGWE